MSSSLNQFASWVFLEENNDGLPEADYYWRIEGRAWWQADSPRPCVEIVCLAWAPIKETPKGVWVERWGERKWVSHTATKRWAYPTRAEAWYSYTRRLKWRKNYWEDEGAKIEALYRELERLGK